MDCGNSTALVQSKCTCTDNLSLNKSITELTHGTILFKAISDIAQSSRRLLPSKVYA